MYNKITPAKFILVCSSDDEVRRKEEMKVMIYRSMDLVFNVLVTGKRCECHLRTRAGSERDEGPSRSCESVGALTAEIRAR